MMGKKDKLASRPRINADVFLSEKWHKKIIKNLEIKN